jgi:hypothetical protein
MLLNSSPTRTVSKAFCSIKSLKIHCEMDGHLGPSLLAVAETEGNDRLNFRALHYLKKLGKKLVLNLH